MKNNFLTIIILFAAILSSCTDDNSPQLTNVVSGEFDALPVNEFVLTEPTSGNPLIITLTWTKTCFYLDGKEQPVGKVEYLVEADIKGNDFANPVTIAASDDNNPLAANLFVNDINTILQKEFKAVGEISLELRLRTNYGEKTAQNYLVSNTVLSVKFTPFRPANELNPAYLVGDMNGWNLNGREFLMYRENNKPKNHVHTYTGKFGANTQFKIRSESLMGNFFFGKGEDNTLIIGGEENFVIATEGYYTITIDDKAMTYEITPFNASTSAEYAVINFVGQFCNWGNGSNEPDMQNVIVKTKGGADIIDTHNWYLYVNLSTVEYGVKFRANNSWTNRWCPVKASESPYGIAELNPPPPSDPNIDLGENTGAYEVRFNDLTGHYFVKKIE